MDDECLKNLGGGNYWKELLDCIRDIRIFSGYFDFAEIQAMRHNPMWNSY